MLTGKKFHACVRMSRTGHRPTRAWREGLKANGFTDRVTSEPVTVTVTEAHIKAAEDSWASLRR